MAEAAVVKRLNKVAVEFNISIQTVVEFLASKGIEVENKPTSRITDEAYEVLLQKFQPDKLVKQKSDALNLTPLIHKEDHRDGKPVEAHKPLHKPEAVQVPPPAPA